MRRIIDFLGLLWRKPSLGLATLGIVLAARISLLLLPFRMIQRVINSADSGHFARAGDYARQYRIVLAVRIVSRLVPGATCLTQAVATKVLLAFRGYRPTLCFGIARDERGGFEAHAWLEENGRIVIGGIPDLQRYQRFGSHLSST